MSTKLDVKPDYKQKEIGEIPKDWQIINLSKVFKLASGKARPPVISNVKSGNYRYPIYGGNGILGYSSEFMLDNKTVVIGRVGEYCGSIHAARNHSWISDNALYAVNINEKEINFDFLISWLKYINPNRFKRKSGQPLMTQSIVYSLNMPKPSINEQKKIAEVLSGVDEVIGKADESIKKTQRFKKGLMQKLLTKGIGHKEFKKTEIGAIPKDWQVVKLKDVVLKTQQIDVRKTKKSYRYVDITSIDNNLNRIKMWSIIDYSNAPSRARKLINDGDVIFATTRPYLRNIAIISKELNGQICSTGFCVIKPNIQYITTGWTFYAVLINRFVAKVSSKMKGATYPAISDDDVFDEKIAIPPIEEQKEIAEILSSVDDRIELLRQRKEKLQRIKKGLMNDLLTGKKRVI